MTKDEFITKLREHTKNKNIKWSKEFRCVINDNGLTCCPITFVHWAENLGYSPQSKFSSAAGRLGLNISDALVIANAADDIYASFPEVYQMQKTLREAVGLA